MSDISENISLPGWASKFEVKTGRRCCVNYFAKFSSLEDARFKYNKLPSGDSLTLQSYQISPIRTCSPQPFCHTLQDVNFSSGRPSPVMGRSFSPLMGSNAVHYLAQKPHEYTTVETSAAKIKSLFPTVSETHIKTLLHKYHYREAVVVSALQVEKHPLTTPGPYSSPLAAAKHVIAHIAPSAPGSPGKFSFSSSLRNLSPRKTPHSSPKMKLRYLKNVFPAVEETVLLDLLCSSENNVQKAIETLTTMGFTKKTDAGTKVKKEDEPYSSKKALNSDSIYIPLRDPLPKTKSGEEKAKIKSRLEKKYQKISERLVALALETADFDEERAEQFLSSIAIEDTKTVVVEKFSVKSRGRKINDYDDPSVKTFRDSGIWEKTSPDTLDNKSSVNSSSCSPNESIETKHISNSQSFEDKRSSPINIECPGSPDNIDKRSENIFKTSLKLRTKIIPKGSNKTLLGQRCAAKGPNPKLQKGSCQELVKGSVYAVPKELTPQLRSNEIQRNECVLF